MIDCRVLILLAALAALAWPAPRADAKRARLRYAVTDLSARVGDDATVSAVSPAGLFAGTVALPDGRRTAFRWSEAEGRARMELPAEAIAAVARAVNDVGRVVGSVADAEGRQQPFTWDRTGEVRLLQTPGGEGWASDVNDDGRVAGTARTPHGSFRAAVWDESGRIRDLAMPDGDSFAVAINGSGDVVGAARTAAGMRAFLWTEAGGMEDLGALDAEESFGLDVSDGLQVIGQSGDRAFLWERERGMRRLARLRGRRGMGVAAISNRGEIVGHAGDADAGSAVAALWRGIQPYDLNRGLPRRSGWRLQSAAGIDRNGRIFGEGLFRGRRRSFLLTPR